MTVRVLYRRRGWLWLAFAVPAAVLAGLIMVVLPPDQTLDHLGEWAFRLSPLVFATLAVATFPRGRFGPALVVLGVLAYMAYVDTALILRVLDYGTARAAGEPGAFQSVYQFQLFVVSYLVLFGLIAFRLGGARMVTALKVGVASVLLVVSGLNDLGFWLLYDWPEGRPAELDWASHITVFVGGPPSVTTAVVFLLVHLALAVAALAAPLERWADETLAAG